MHTRIYLCFDHNNTHCFLKKKGFLTLDWRQRSCSLQSEMLAAFPLATDQPLLGSVDRQLRPNYKYFSFLVGLNLRDSTDIFLPRVGESVLVDPIVNNQAFFSSDPNLERWRVKSGGGGGRGGRGGGGGGKDENDPLRGNLNLYTLNTYIYIYIYCRCLCDNGNQS